MEHSQAIDDPDDNIIRLRIDHYSQLAHKPVWSEKRNYMGFPWQLLAQCEDDLLVVYTNVMKVHESNVWFCDATAETTMVNQKDEELNHLVTPVRRERLTPGVNGMGTTLLKTSLLANRELGFIKDDVVIVQVRITVHSVNGKRFRNKIAYNPFTPSSTSDGILIVEGKKVYVSKQLLAIQSSFFERMFFGRFKEAHETESVLEDLSLAEFKVLLNMVYRTGQSFTINNVEFLLDLADRFDMKSVLDDAENFLLTAKELDLHTKFRLSDRYNLFVLQDQVLPHYTSDMIRELKMTPEYEMLKEHTKDLLFDKYVEFTNTK